MEMASSVLCHALIMAIICIHLSISITPTLATETLPAKSNNTQFIKTSCNSTTYPKLCYRSLAIYAAKIKTNPKVLAHMALNVTLRATQSASRLVTNMSKIPGLTRREAAAMADCVEQVSDSVDLLQQSIAEMGHADGPDFEFAINNIQTWVSAALTNEDTCMDGFAGNAMNGNVKAMVRRGLLKVAHLTSNALALINANA